jgi:uncharacterized protein
MQFKGTGSLLLKDLDTKQGIVSAYWSAFGNKDDGGDIVMLGNWAKSIRERGPKSSQPRIKFLYQHQETMLISKPSELVEDSVGLLATCQIPPTTLGLDVITLYAYEILTEHSVGYETVQAQWDAKNAARLLIESVLWEGSCVTWGMNSETPMVALKSLTQPVNLLAMADRAQKLDKLLHNGNLRSDALCETLNRELKSLHAALAPSKEAERPYTIKGVIDSMTALADRLTQKSATGKTSWPLGDRKAAWDNGAAHKRIVEWATKDGGDLDVAKMKSVHFYSPEGDDAEDKSKFKLLFCDVVDGKVEAMPRALMACWGAHGVDGTTGVSDDDKAAIKKKLSTYAARMRDEFDDDSIMPPWDKEDGDKSSATTRMIKGSGGEIEVSDDGTHSTYTGTHSHSHKTMGSQGDDDTHEHEHNHKGDAKHEHEHEKARPSVHRQKADDSQRPRKARDFDTLFQSLNASDQLQDDWGDTFIAFTRCMEELMWQAQIVRMGWTVDGGKDFDLMGAAQSNIDAFRTALLDLIKRSDAADFCPQLDWDGDQFTDPDGCNAHPPELGDADGWDSDYKSRRPQSMPDAPAPLRKAGRAISGANREIITEALDGMADAMKDMKQHHDAIKDLMEKTDPDHVRQDEDSVLGDDDSENGGKNPNKGRFTPHTQQDRPAPERHSIKAATTHQGLDTSLLDDELDALRRRRTGGKV